MKCRTSFSDPIRVDFLPLTGLPGQLGLTLAPGKKARGIYAQWNRNLELDLARLQGFYGVNRLVTLLEEHELKLLRIEKLRERVVELGIHSSHLPIPDGGVPKKLEPVHALVQKIMSDLVISQTIVLHCRGGLGRAGTIAACVLIGLGHSPETAILLTRMSRPGAIENILQERFVQRYAKSYRRGR